MKKAPRTLPDDSEASSTKEKGNPSATPATNGKGKRGANNAVHANASGTHSTPAASGTVAGAAGSTSNTDGNVGIQWSEFDPNVLHRYRYEHRMNTPPAFNNSYNQTVLSQSSIGRMSPSMVRKKEHKRQSKDQLANAVRKHFNSQSVNETEVIVNFLYKVRYQDKKFRMRFMPQLRHA
ncbi:hypothetical protein DSL72_005093 [Monilinia vaccinii-corymbosi]|uniref:Histone deacetylase complex subunit SAP30 Sin3 binding domain-containing protein n=1 Tax=Monilinia vaccinii-corymbosi TaxID=61207 RepID=A0A8A3PEM8_9HELO|nr:hypothetical protein DSL72_005093 [Monilinia vaccinii-corymbosi]